MKIEGLIVPYRVESAKYYFIKTTCYYERKCKADTQTLLQEANAVSLVFFVFYSYTSSNCFRHSVLFLPERP